jgi:hypothetical protein
MKRSIRQAPLRDREADAALFVEPDGFGRLLWAAREGLNVLVLGPRGGGKTSALRQLQLRLRGEGGGPPAVFVDLAGARSPAMALQIVVALASEHLGTALPWRPVAPRPYEDDDDFTARSAIDQLEAIEPCRFLLDNASPEPVAHALFGTFRDRLWETPHQWLLAGDLHDRERLLRPPADGFWEEVVELSLTERHAADLIALRLGQRPGWLGEMVDQAGTNPRRLLRAALDATSDVEPADAIAARRDWNARVAALGERPARLLAELESLGPVSASDPQLRDRLGWARTTVQRALNELEAAGLVRSWEQSEGQGRPRRLFTVVAPGGTNEL